MGFYETNIQGEIQKNKSESVDFAKAWKESREEYRLIGEMIALQKQKNMTQTKLVDLLDSSQQS